MPSTATITAFYTFTQNTVIKSSEHNTNFSTFRGHLIAVDPNTATAAATLTYDLGASDRYWRAGYIGQVNANTVSASSLVATTATVTSLVATTATISNLSLGATSTISDSLFHLGDNSDSTKRVRFELSSITTATTRVITVSDADINIGKAPTVQKFTSGSGTYTTPAGVRYIRVQMIGGGGGGAGSGTAAGTAPTAGGTTTFGTSFLTCNGGAIGDWANYRGGAGGTATISAGTGIVVAGGAGGGSGLVAASISHAGGMGGSGAFGGAGGGGGVGDAGRAAVANSGAGGGGGGTGATAASQAGPGGGSGGYIDLIIVGPSSTYSYAVGAGGNAGGAGTNGFAGGAGAAGVIIVTEYYS